MEKIKVGVLGLGRAGYRMHFPELERFPELFEIVAGCDNDPERRANVAESHPKVKLYDNAADFVKDPDVELVTVATRTPLHVEHSVLALDAGKYVFNEKPIAVDYESALKLREADKRHPGKLFIRHNRRFEPAFEHIMSIIHSGKLGYVYEIKLRRNSYDWRADWQTLQSCGGGQLLNWGPHIVDHAMRFLESPVKDVWSDLKLVAARGDAEDHVRIILRGENDRVVDLEISGGCSLHEPVYVVNGTLGTLISDNELRLHLKYINPAAPKPTFQATGANPPVRGGFGGGVKPEWIEDDIQTAPATGDDTWKCWKYLYESIRNGAKFPVTLDEALENMRVIDMVKKGTPVVNVRDR